MSENPILNLLFPVSGRFTNETEKAYLASMRLQLSPDTTLSIVNQLTCSKLKGEWETYSMSCSYTAARQYLPNHFQEIKLTWTNCRGSNSPAGPGVGARHVNS